ncbi:replication-relaxation family protein [Embleya sp. NPDC050154]|uniref:replication-relaxation family protein n=1 Tax=Embleya sp. NPDC050154 TaxID=3363988 RepID=UPI0037A11060
MPAGNVARSRIRDLVEQLTDQDRLVLRALATHRVLTSHQVTEMAFNSPSTARRRMKDLEDKGAVHRFRPCAENGSHPLHLILSPAGAAVLAVEMGEEPGPAARRALGDRRFILMSGLRLTRLLGVDAFRAALESHAREHPDAAVEQWYGADEIPDMNVPRGLDRPDAVLIWRDGPHRSVLAVEFDTGTEQPRRLADRVARYAYARPRRPQGDEPVEREDPVVLFVFGSTLRESNARATLTYFADEVPIATGVWRPGTSPAGALWLPWDRQTRTTLARLGEARHRSTPDPTP